MLSWNASLQEKKWMKDRYFLDTNIVLYTFDHKDLRKKKIASDLIQNGLIYSISRVSFQVIQEFMNVTTRSGILELKPEDVIQYTSEILIPQCDMRPTFELLFEALHIQRIFKYSFYDSLIISAAIEQQCRILYSEDLHHHHKLKGLEIVNPFVWRDFFPGFLKHGDPLPWWKESINFFFV